MTQTKRPADASQSASVQPPVGSPRTAADNPGEAVPPGGRVAQAKGQALHAIIRRPAAAGDGAAGAANVVPWDPDAASMTEQPGMQPVTVRWCPNPEWHQSTVWVAPHASADNLKHLLQSRAAAHPSALRVIQGVGGIPIVHNTPLWPKGPPPADAPRNVFVLVPSFG